MVRRVAEFTTRYNMFVPGQAVGVAVSGGADSVCLLHVLRELAPRWALRLTVLHVDHQLRGEASHLDAEFVADLARNLGLAVHVRRVDVEAVRAGTGGNLEQTARDVRRQFFFESIAQGLVEKVATGHTRSDQAETVLLRLLRGAGPGGLAGILPVTSDGLVRPLLEVGRAEVEAFLRERDVRWREDASNQNLDFARNRLRRQVLPELARNFNPAVEEVLARTAALARETDTYLEAEAVRIASDIMVNRPPAVLMQARALAGLPRPVARQLVRQAIRQARGDLRRIEFGHVDRIVVLAEKKEGHGRLRLPGVEVVRSFDWMRLVPPVETAGHALHFCMPLEVPGAVTLPGGAGRLEARLSGGSGAIPGLNWEAVPRPLAVRNWLPGDQYLPYGCSEPVRLKKLFQAKKIPLWERSGWPVVTGGGEVLWARRFGPAAKFIASGSAGAVLELEETGPVAV